MAREEQDVENMLGVETIAREAMARFRQLISTSLKPTHSNIGVAYHLAIVIGGY